MRSLRTDHGFTLVEVMIVIAIMSVLAGLAIPYYQPNATIQLQAAAEIVAADVAFARSMAVSRNNEYTISFDIAENAYSLSHTGGVPALANLPNSPFHYEDDATERTTQLESLPHWGEAAKLVAVYSRPDSGAPTSISSVVFEPSGNTAYDETTAIWLSVGSGTVSRFISVEIDPVTGLESVSEVTSTMPLGIVAAESVSPSE